MFAVALFHFYPSTGIGNFQVNWDGWYKILARMARFSKTHTWPISGVLEDPRQLAREMEQARTTARRNPGEVEQAARAAGVDCETYFEEENQSVPDAIAHFTQQKKCDLVVMGTNGRHGLAAMLKPSNAKAVAKYLAVPVLVVH